MARKDITTLTPVQREVLEALRDGGMITIDRYNMPWLGDRMLQPISRYFLTDNDLVTRFDKSRPVEARGNGFVISEKGLALLVELPSRRKIKSKSPQTDWMAQAEPSLPTERQLAFARDLGISVPADATIDEVSDLIPAHLEKDKPASDNHRRIALLFGVKFTRFTGKKQLFERIFNTVSKPTHELDLTAWFAYRVYRHLVRGAESVPITGPDQPTIQEIATQLVSDEAALRSIRRYNSNGLLFFGEWTSPSGTLYTGGSKQTAGYEKASSLLQDKLNITE